MYKRHKQDLVKGTFWSVLGRISYLVVALISNIILARLLTPNDFGQVGIVMFFIVMANVLTESGLAGALIRKRNISETDYSTVLIFNIFVSSILMISLFSSSGMIADFYEDSSLESIIQAMSSILLINAFQIYQITKLTYQLEFKKKSLYQLISISLSAIIGISLAFQGYGVWALVIMQILTSFFLTALLWIFEGGVSKLVFDKKCFQGIYRFGLNTTLSAILISVFDNIYQLVIGKFFGITQTGLFYQAKKLQEIPVGTITTAMIGPVYAVMAKIQGNEEEFVKFYKRILTIFSIIIGLICILIFYYAENFILLLYGDKWIGAVFFLKILILSSFFYMQELFSRVIFKIFDNTQKILYIELLKKLILIITIVIGMIYRDVEILIYGFLFTSVLGYFINYIQLKKVWNETSYYELILMIKVIVISLLSISFTYYLQALLLLDGFSTFCILPALILSYLIMARLFKITNIVKETIQVWSLIRNRDK